MLIDACDAAAARADLDQLDSRRFDDESAAFLEAVQPCDLSWDESVGAPCAINPIFAVVPPMSNETSVSMPIHEPRKRAASTPAAGPDSSILIGIADATSASVRPPLDSMTWN